MKGKEIRSMSEDEITGKLDDLTDKLFKQRVQKSLGQTDNPHQIRQTRKDIARLKTILAEKRFKNGTRDEKKES
jgi:large subunit ribosomal protein L29